MGLFAEIGGQVTSEVNGMFLGGQVVFIFKQHI